MLFRQFKNRTTKLLTTCEHCGEPIEQNIERCKNCKQIATTTDNKQVALPVAENERGELRMQLQAPQGHAIDITDRQIGDVLSPIQERAWTGEKNPLRAAPFKRRVAAAMLDHGLVGSLELLAGLIIFTPFVHYMMTSHVLFGQELFHLGPSSEYQTSFLIIFFLACFSIVSQPIMYFALFESSGWQATPGKRWLDLKVASLNGGQVTFRQAFGKSIFQYVFLYLISVVLALSLALIIFASTMANLPFNQGIAHLIFYLTDFVAAAIVLCFPFFRSGTQSILDRVLGRMVVSQGDFDEDRWRVYTDNVAREMGSNRFLHILGSTWKTIYWIGAVLMVLAMTAIAYLFLGLSWKLAAIVLVATAALIGWEKLGSKIKWEVVKVSSCAAMGLSLVLVLSVAIPYDWVFLTKSEQAIAIAEKGFELDPDGQHFQAHRYIEQSLEIFPDLWMTYSLDGSLANTLGLDALSSDLKHKSEILSDFKRRKHADALQDQTDKASPSAEKGLHKRHGN